MIRDARREEIPRLIAIEIAGGERFRSLGMAAVAEDAPPTVEQLERFVDAGGALVATDAVDLPIAYLLVEPLDGDAHIEQVTVHPSAAGRRIGAGLLAEAARWARVRGMPALSLTTFEAVPWNAPYYERLGFVRTAPGEWGPELRARMTEETSGTLRQWPRVAMRRPLGEP